MCSLMRSCVSLYEELSGRPLPRRDVHTPFSDDETNWIDGGERGELTDVALRALMKVLYGTHMCKCEILRATCMLARRFPMGSGVWSQAMEFHDVYSYHSRLPPLALEMLPSDAR